MYKAKWLALKIKAKLFDYVYIATFALKHFTFSSNLAKTMFNSLFYNLIWPHKQAKILRISE